MIEDNQNSKMYAKHIRIHVMLIAFACNAKSFAIAIIFFFLFFSTANLDRQTKAACGTFQIF